VSLLLSALFTGKQISEHAFCICLNEGDEAVPLDLPGRLGLPRLCVTFRIDAEGWLRMTVHDWVRKSRLDGWRTRCETSVIACQHLGREALEDGLWTGACFSVGECWVGRGWVEDGQLAWSSPIWVRYK